MYILKTNILQIFLNLVIIYNICIYFLKVYVEQFTSTRSLIYRFNDLFIAAVYLQIDITNISHFY